MSGGIKKMTKEKIRELVSQMTLEEKAALCSGKDNWHTKGIERLGIPEIMVSDGPHGLRKEIESAHDLVMQQSIPAVCFPAGCALAASFDRDLVRKVGEAIGRECQAADVQVILGPAVNIKRSPLCGRNFEYFSEDPFVASEMAKSYIEGVQSQGVGACIKHFLANNQECLRQSSSSEVDERTLREIYLAVFEGAIKDAKPWAVMCSYNKINGIYASENSKFLTDILRKEWGYDGPVMSDWGAVHDRVAAVRAGCDLTMPAAVDTDHLLVEAVRNGEIDEGILDTACERILELVYRGIDNKNGNIAFDYEGDHRIAQYASEESIVLLKNEDSILPLNKNAKIAFIGKYADKPRYQGGGSSHVNSFKVTSALEAVRALKDVFTENIVYAQGFEDDTDVVNEKLKLEAIEAAAASDVAVIFVGLPELSESEGYDRVHMRLPNCQNDLISAICAVQPNTVVVLHNGAPVEMPWIDNVKAVLETYLGGQAVGAAVVNVLFGKVNPSGRLPETFPIKLEDNPSYLFFGQGSREANRIEYREGIFVGYRYYETKRMNVLFPFGYGLSYTTFEYSNLRLDKTKMKDTDTLYVSVDVANTGSAFGKEVIQLYIAPPKGSIVRPVRELKAFEKVGLNPGETKTVTFILDKRSFAYWDTKLNDWYVESGVYVIQIGKSAKDIVLEEKIEIISDTVILKENYDMTTTIKDFIKHPKGKAFWNKILPELITGFVASGFIDKEKAATFGIDIGEKGTISDELVRKLQAGEEFDDGSGRNTAFLMNQPIGILTTFIPDLKAEDLQKLLDEMNSK